MDDRGEFSWSEAEIERNPYGIRGWVLAAKARPNFSARRVVYERAVRFLPRSYKLWWMYLQEYETAVRDRWITSTRAETLAMTYERALVHLHKMPRIWIGYLTLLKKQGKVTKARQAFDACLRALPVTQHAEVWPIVEKTTRMWYRYVMFDPSQRDHLVEALLAEQRFDEAVEQLALQDNWVKLCDIPTTKVDVDTMMRTGITKHPQLWCKLADFYIRSGRFEKARDIYEEALTEVRTVRDFAMVFDAYAQYEEALLAVEDDELQMARLENLITQRPVLLSSVILRQNPSSVPEWHARAQLFQDKRKRMETYAEAVKTIGETAVKPQSLWLALAREYDLVNARKVLDEAAKAPMRKDDLADLYCQWAEMEMKNEQYEAALQVMQRASKLKSPKVWALYLDLQESLGSTETTSAAYDRALQIKVATPLMVLNYASYLEERQYFEKAFRAYEKGLALFTWPHSRDIWFTYIPKFTSRSSKVERARDLFEQALASNPPVEDRDRLYVLYAKFEEQHGLASRSLRVYERAATSALTYEAFALYIAKVQQMCGATKARPVYEKGIELLDDPRRLCIDFAKLETRLGEIDRARAIYAHAAQFADPNYWQVWRDFEVAHGNEDTFRDMLRIQRSVDLARSINSYTAKRPSDNPDVDAQADERAQPAPRADEQQQQDPNEIDLEDDDDDDVELEQRPVPQAVFGNLEEKEPLGALARFSKANS